MQKQDNRNMLLAIVLSGAVLLGWNYFYGVPKVEKQLQQAQTSAPAATQPGAPGAAPPSATATPGTPGIAGAPGAGPTLQATLTREAAIASGPRIQVETSRIFGSIALTGARIDDVSLKNYRETVDPRSANIVLLSPANAPNPYYADFGWVSATGLPTPTATTIWTAGASKLTPDRPVTLSWDNGQGLVFRRIISVDDNAMFSVRDEVENKGQGAATLFPYGLVARHAKPVTLGFYVLHEGLIGVLGEQGLQEYTYDAVDKEPLLAGTTRGKSFKDTSGGFVGITDKYWATAIVPDQTRKFEGRLTSMQPAIGPRIYQADMLGEAQTLAPGTAGTATTRFFAGAKEVAAIDGYQTRYNILRFDRLIDWGWFYFITKPMFLAMDWIFHIVGNFGVAILLITVVIKLLFLPLANKSYTSMAKMKSAQPEMLAIRERYADDKMKQQQAMMELYKKEKINPLAGCWPVLIQIPVFFALYKVLFVTIEMRHAPFFGWIKDLAAPDPTSIFNLFGLLPFNPGAVPVFGTLLMLGVWPILMGITMFVQMKMNPDPPDPIQKQIFTWMPLVFMFMLASFPAGLVIYWTWNNLLSVLQQGYIMKKNNTKIELFDNIKSLFVKPAANANIATAATSSAKAATAKPSPEASTAADVTTDDVAVATPSAPAVATKTGSTKVRRKRK
jgi:YidC/Oxa1 family membrane protein insertase